MVFILKLRDGFSNKSFGIRCCPEIFFPINERTNCEWHRAMSGVAIECPINEAGRMQMAVGRCSTSARNDDNGACVNDTVHTAFCCDTSTVVDHKYCGWLYETYGKNLVCPVGLLATGFCGVNNKADCNQGTKFAGIKCCPAEPY